MMKSRFKRNERLYQIALRSHWTFSAKLAAGGLAIGVFFVPLLLANNPDLASLASTVQFLGAFFTIVFVGVAIYRFVILRREERAATTINKDGEGD